MKKLLLLLFIETSLQAATITNYITDSFGNPLKTRIIITPFTISTVFGGTNVLGPSVGVECTNGGWFATLLFGFYYVDQGLAQPQIVVWATPGDTNTYTLAQMAIAANAPIPSFFSGSPPNQIPFLTNTLIVVTQIVERVTEVFTNLWPGASNVIDFLNGSDQHFTSLTACSVTGVANKGINTVRTTTLSLLNPLGNTNWLLTLAPTIETRDGLRQYTVTNGQDFIISFRYKPDENRTNSVTATQF